VLSSGFSNGQNASTVIGLPSLKAHWTSSAPSPYNLYNPADVAFDSLGNLWVSDTGNNRVLQYQPPFSNGMPATSALGQGPQNGPPSWNTFASATTQNGLSDPMGIQFDVHGNLWVADRTNNRVIEFIPPSKSSTAYLVGNYGRFVLTQFRPSHEDFIAHCQRTTSENMFRIDIIQCHTEKMFSRLSK
jgi:DNA-binding beta-propeller fold protein YncE